MCCSACADFDSRSNSPLIGMSIAARRNYDANTLYWRVNQFLLPQQNVRAALDLFVTAELEALPVVASATDHSIIGFITEAYALRRYSQELERARAGDLRDNTLFGPA